MPLPSNSRLTITASKWRPSPSTWMCSHARPCRMKSFTFSGVTFMPASLRRDAARASDATGRLGHAAILGDRLHRPGHPQVEHILLVLLDVFGELADRRHRGELLEVFARLHDLFPLLVVQLIAVGLGHRSADLRRPVTHIDEITVSIALRDLHGHTSLLEKCGHLTLPDCFSQILKRAIFLGLSQEHPGCREPPVLTPGCSLSCTTIRPDTGRPPAPADLRCG